MTVKQLIELLSQLDNKLYEVEVCIMSPVQGQLPIRHVMLPNSQRKKVVIMLKE